MFSSFGFSHLTPLVSHSRGIVKANADFRVLSESAALLPYPSLSSLLPSEGGLVLKLTP